MSKNRKSPIPIKNLFYMLCYAWNVLAIKNDIKIGSDDYNDAYNLLSHIFSYGVGKIIRSGFHRSYVEQTEELATIRGKVSMQKSITSMSIQRKRLVCKYDEYSTNDAFNQILRYTIESLINNPDVNDITKKELKMRKLFFAGIDSNPPTKNTLLKLVFNQNNIIYKLLIDVATILYNNTVVNEEDGFITFKDFYRQKQMEKVFELFIRNFYSLHLRKETYRVHAPKIKWPIADNGTDIWGETFDVGLNPGDRRTDIVIENKSLNLQMIFDAKYYGKTLVSSYMNEEELKARTGHLNQIRGYLLDSKYNGKKVGALIYPMVNNDLSKGTVYPIKDTPIIIKTINLLDNWKKIETDMLDFIRRIENTQQKH